jgi:hypothetical protein
MRYTNGVTLPTLNNFFKMPKLGGIGSPCVCFNTVIAKGLKWDGWKCGDYRFIVSLWAKTSAKRWIRTPLVQLGTQWGNFGRRNDIPEAKPTIPSKPIVSKNTFRVKNKPKTEMPNEVPIANTVIPPITISILACGWNCKDYIGEFVNSIERQKGKWDYHVYCCDDCSTDGTHEKLLGMVRGNPRYTLIRNPQSMGAAYSRWQLLQKMPMGTIVLQVDMDDYLLGDAFGTLAQAYSDPNTMMTLGNYQGKNIVSPPRAYTSETIEQNLYNREKVFLAPAPRSFRSSLIGSLDETMFKDRQGNWLRYCTDVPLVLGLLRACGGKSVKVIDKPIYHYRERNDKKGTLKLYGAKKKEILGWLLNKFSK